MSFDTFCGQEPTDPNTYQKVLTRFLPPLGILAVNAGANITIVNPAAPIVSVANPLNATLNFGGQSLQDSGGQVGAAGQFLSAGAGGQTLWANQTDPTVDTTNANAVVYPVFVDGGGGVPRQLLCDDTITPISVNCATGDFIVVDTIRVQSAGAVAVGKSIASVAPQQASAIAVGLNAARDNQGGSAVAIGATSGDISQGANAVAIGANAGRDTQGLNCVALGYLTGEQNQGANATALGHNAGNNTQGANCVAVGHNAADTNQGTNAVSVGHNGGENNQSAGAVAVGFNAAQNNQGVNSVAIGREAGQETQGLHAVAVGGFAGEDTQSANATAVGYQAGQTTQGASAVSVGFQAGQTNQSSNSVAVGRLAGNANQLVGAIAIGNTAGQTSQQTSAIAIGVAAGNNTQSANAVAIGNTAGQTNQSVRSVAVGFGAGTTTQGQEAVAVGDDAGSNNQGASAVAVGNGAGTTTQGASAVAVGDGAGNNNQGANAVAIGNLAGQTNQFAGSICLNATGVAVNPAAAGLFVAPVRSLTTNQASQLQYNPTTKEVIALPNSQNVMMEDFDMFDTASNFFGNTISFAESGVGSTSYFSGVFEPAILTGALYRRGFVQFFSGGASGNSTNLITDLLFSYANISKLTFGIVPHGNANISTATTAVGNIVQQLGISSAVSSTGVGATNTVLWRLSSLTAAVPVWQFVINNVVQFTLTLANGDMTAKWCRAEIDVNYGGGATATVSGTWYNLTDGTSETTGVYTITQGVGFPNPLTTPNTVGIVLGTLTNTSQARYMGIDYVELQQVNLLPVGSGTTETTGR